MATQEAPVHQNVKDAIVAATELDTRLVMRGLRNTERVLTNSAVEQLIKIEKARGAETDSRGSGDLINNEGLVNDHCTIGARRWCVNASRRRFAGNNPCVGPLG